MQQQEDKRKYCELVGARNKPDLGRRLYLYSLAAAFSSLAQTMSVLDPE